MYLLLTTVLTTYYLLTTYYTVCYFFIILSDVLESVRKRTQDWWPLLFPVAPETPPTWR